MGSSSLTPEQLRIRALERNVLLLGLDSPHRDAIVASLRNARRHEFGDRDTHDTVDAEIAGAANHRQDPDHLEDIEALRAAQNALEQTGLVLGDLVRSGQPSGSMNRLQVLRPVVEHALIETERALARHGITE